MVGQDVFISYKSEEFSQADWVRQHLEQAGISCWMAPASITGGSSYAVEIPQAIRQCQVFVLILSRQAQQSRWIPKELDQAINYGKTVLPFMLEDCPLENDFSFYLSNVQRYPAYAGMDAAMARMQREILTLLGRPPVPPSKLTPPPGPQSQPAPEPAPTLQQEIITIPYPKSKKASRHKRTAEKPPHPLHILGRYVLLGILMVLVVNGLILLLENRPVTIAGNRFSIRESDVSLQDATLQEKDFSTLAKMPKLHSLRLKNCTFDTEDLSGLQSQTVSWLVLSNCILTAQQLTTLDLTAFSKLNLLDLTGLEALYQLPALPDGLYGLDISNTGITTLTGLETLSRLHRLTAVGLSISDLSSLANCTNLDELDISDTNVTDLSPLSSCTKLTILRADRTPLTTLHGLENCIELSTLSVQDAKLTDLDGLQNTTLLKNVQLSGNPLTQVDVLANSVPQLKRLYLDDADLSDLSWLQGAPQLEYLSVNHNHLQDLDFLEGCDALEGLSAAGNEIQSAASLAGLPALWQVVLRDNALTGEPEIHFSTELRPVLDLANNPITGLTLTSERGISLLDLSGTDIPDAAPLLKDLECFRLILNYQEQTDWDALGNSNITYFTVLNCPLVQQVAVREALHQNVTYADGSSEAHTDQLTDALRGLS